MRSVPNNVTETFILDSICEGTNYEDDKGIRVFFTLTDLSIYLTIFVRLGLSNACSIDQCVQLNMQEIWVRARFHISASVIVGALEWTTLRGFCSTLLSSAALSVIFKLTYLDCNESSTIYLPAFTICHSNVVVHSIIQILMID